MKHSEDYGHKTHTFLFRFDINKKKIPNTIYMKNEIIKEISIMRLFEWKW